MNDRNARNKRYREIVSVFAKYGFGPVGRLSRHRGKGGDFRGKAESGKNGDSRGKRLRLAFQELGPTYVKLGQLLSIRHDMLPTDITEELGKLQDAVQPFPFSEVRAVIETEFGDKLEDVYREFDREPIAAASISQVHRAKLSSGKEVAVKVQRPDIEESIRMDLDILKDMARFADHHTKYGKLYHFTGFAEEFENTLCGELDFAREGENADCLRQNLSKDEGITIPRVRWVYTTKRVLTMEYFDGLKISDRDALEQAGIDCKMVAERIATSLLNQILRDGFFHGDPHPGNIQVLPDGTVVFLDFGMMGRLTETQKRAITDFFVGIVLRDSRMVVDVVIDMDAFSGQEDKKDFQKAIDIIIDRYLTTSMREIKIDMLLRDIFQIAYSYHMRIPHEFTLLGKTIGTLQALLEKLDPETNALVIAEPIAKKLVVQSFSLKGMKGQFKESLIGYGHLFHEFPAAMRVILRKVKKEELTLPLEIKDMDTVQRRLERISNRLSFSMILLAVSIIIAGVLISSGLSANMSTELQSFHVVAIKLGSVVAIAIILGLIISMFRSSR